MNAPDPDLDHFIAENLSPEERSRGRVGTILGPDDEREPASGHVVLLEHVSRAYVLKEPEFELLDENWNS